MNWTDDLLCELVGARDWGYHRGQPTATEPTAFTALALLAHGLRSEADAPLAWLAAHQAHDGSLGVTADQSTPGWPTSLAVLAWRHADRSSGNTMHQAEIDLAIQWLLGVSGTTLDRQEDMGHDTTLLGWPWVVGTHSWLEPTAFAVLALKVAGYRDHPRTQDAVRLIVDRLLPDGGCNYGNTVVLGQPLRPHVQPSGIALSAAFDERDSTGRISRTIDYLKAEFPATTTSISLSFALLGLGAAGALPSNAFEQLAEVAQDALNRRAGCYPLALLALAAQADRSPLS